MSAFLLSQVLHTQNIGIHVTFVIYVDSIIHLCLYPHSTNINYIFWEMYHFNKSHLYWDLLNFCYQMQLLYFWDEELSLLYAFLFEPAKLVVILTSQPFYFFKCLFILSNHFGISSRTFCSVRGGGLFSFYFPYLGEIIHISIHQLYLPSVRIFDFPSLPGPGIEPTTASCVFWITWCWNSWALNLMSVVMCKASGSSCQCLTLALSVISASVVLLSWLNSTKAANYTFPSV